MATPLTSGAIEGLRLEEVGWPRFGDTCEPVIHSTARNPPPAIRNRSQSLSHRFQIIECPTKGEGGIVELLPDAWWMDWYRAAGGQHVRPVWLLSITSLEITAFISTFLTIPCSTFMNRRLHAYARVKKLPPISLPQWLGYTDLVGNTQ